MITEMKENNKGKKAIKYSNFPTNNME